MGLFGKKKPWDYNTDLEKMASIASDYSEDKKVLRKVLKNESSVDVRAVALLSLIFCEDDLSFDPIKLIKYMTDLGVSAEDTSKILINLAEHVERATKDKD